MNTKEILQGIKDWTIDKLGGKVDKTTTINGHSLSGNVSVTKSDIGLGSVTDDAQVKRSEMGVASGVATLDSAGKVPTSQLPSFVDDVLEYDDYSLFPETGEVGKIYVDKSNNTTWRWSGTVYVQIKGDLVIGTTTGTAADGGIASSHYNNTSNPHSVTKDQVGLGNVANTGDSATPTENGTEKFTTGGAYTELNKKVDKVSGKGLSTNDYTTDEKEKLDGIEDGATNVTTDTVSGWGFTKNEGTVTSIKINGTAKNPSDGVVDLGTVITTHQDISGKVDKTTTINGHELSSNVSITKSDVGLGNVGNFKAVSTDASQGLTDTEKENARENIGAGTGNGTITGINMNGSSKGTSGVIDLGTVIIEHQDISGKVDKTTTINGHALSDNVSISKSDIGLGNVTNDAQVKRTEMGVSSGVATLDETGKIPSSQLPSYVDDVLEFNSVNDFPTEGETGKIYVDKSTNLSWRWGGTDYVQISPSLALGETSSTAYAGNKGKALADKLATIEEGADANVQSDWNATEGDAFIKNKPVIPTVNNAKFSIKADGIEVASTTANASTESFVDIVEGDNVSISHDTEHNKITISATDTKYASIPAASGGTDVSLVTTGEKYTWNNKSDFSGSYKDLSNKPIMSKVIVTGNVSSSCSITGVSNDGMMETIIYVNGGSSDYIVSVPTVYSTPNGAALEITCPSGGYCEVSYLNIDDTIYARGL